MDSNSLTISRISLDTDQVPWSRGVDAVKSMDSQYRENLGEADGIPEIYQRYSSKSLRADPLTTRRIDLVEIEPGFIDTPAYHESVEECFIISGEVDVLGEGRFWTGDYFWRPPGFVHAASTSEGFKALLIMHGEDSSEMSGKASRHIRPPGDLGKNVIYSERSDKEFGGRGFVRSVRTSGMGWISGYDSDNLSRIRDFVKNNCAVKVLSENTHTGAQTILMRLDPGYQETKPTRSKFPWEMFALEGSCSIGESVVPTSGYECFPKDHISDPISSDEGAVVFLISGFPVC